MKNYPAYSIFIVIVLLLSSLACSLTGGASTKSPPSDVGQATLPAVSETTQLPVEETQPITEAVQPELIGGLTPGWHIYSNANHVKGLALHQDTLWAAGLGGVVAWELNSGQYTKYTTLDGMGYLGAYDVTVCSIPDVRIIGATEKGLSFYDPVNGGWDSDQITPLDGNVGSNRIDKVYCDQANNRLLIGYAGLGMYNFSNGDWRHIVESDGLAFNTVTGIAVVGSDIYVSGYKGVTRIHADGSLQVYNSANGMPEQDTRAILADSDGALWLGTSNGLVRFKDNAWSLYNRDNTPDFPSASINALAFAPNGSLWLATPYEEIVEFAPTSQSVKQVFKRPDQKIVTDLLVDDNGQVLYATADNGIFALQASTWQPMRIESDQLLSNYVSSFGADQEGMLWVGTDKGAQRLDPAQADQPWQAFTADPNGPPTNQFQKIRPDTRGVMWFVHDGRWISRYDGSAWQRIGSEQEVAGSTADVAVGADGIKYIATSEGLTIIGGASTTTLTEADGLPNKNVRSLLLDGDTLWIGTVDGLARLNGTQVEVVLGPKTPGLPDDNIGVIFNHKDGSLLLGTSGGLAKFDGSQATTILVPEALRTNFFGLTTQSVADITIDSTGTLWVATYVGLYRGDGDNWERLTTLDGLPTNNLNAVFVDKLGTVWVGGGYSDAGGAIARFVPGEAKAPATPVTNATIAAPATTQAVPQETPQSTRYDPNTGLPLFPDADEIYSTEDSLNYWSLSSFESLRDFYLEQLPYKGWLLDIDEDGNCYDKDRCMGWHGYGESDNSTWFFLQGEHAYLTLNLLREGYRVNVIISIDPEFH